MAKSGIYQIINLVNGKKYVGSAVNLEHRKAQHLSDLRKGIHHNPHLQSSWNKYGADAFEFCIVGRCSPERLIELEQEVMDHLKPEYNIVPTAGSSLGRKHSEETRRRMSMAFTGRTHTKEHNRKIGEAHRGNQYNLGRRHTLETRQRLSETMKLWWHKRKEG